MPRPIQPEDLLGIKTVSDVQLSPDGTRIAYVLTTIDTPHDEYRSHIWIVSADGGEPIQFTHGPKHD
ncbi:MAG: S9 family peptidase, partial [Chloroflexi bacterium]|nr:S9 family peptidase [Chloroflexota bacterium]